MGKGKNSSESFTFQSIPSNLEELKKLPEAKLDTPFKTAALTILALCRHKESPDDAIEMLNFLKGPEDVSTYEKGFFKERLAEREYIPFSYFNGATPQNGYTPTNPMTIAVYENPYSFDNEHWATLWVKSGGADNMRSLKFRQKPSTGEWFLNDIQCLSDIRLPTEKDAWA
ncbi:MAG: hypothetical protein E7656_07555 [Ruminococcaceae bacterium]|nr:hypothetical protein [Oscillospiraceae bacterium]